MKLQTCSVTPQVLVDVIEQYVQSRTRGMVRGLHVELVDGKVVMSGRASTYYAKQLATHAAMAAIEDVSLTNDIEVC
jgi:hypothetical protein